MLTPRILSLDLDDTLWAVAPVIAAAERDLLAWLRSHHPAAANGHDLESMRALRSRVCAEFPGRRHDLTFVRRRALLEQFAAAGYDKGRGAAAPADQALDVFLAARNRVTLYADARPALIRLRSKYRLFALSNGNADLRRCGLADLFEGHITAAAAAAGAAKPDVKIFARLSAEAGVDPIEVMHVGDDPLADVVGATQAGMQATWLNRDDRPWPVQYSRPVRTISTLAEIS